MIDIYEYRKTETGLIVFATPAAGRQLRSNEFRAIATHLTRGNTDSFVVWFSGKLSSLRWEAPTETIKAFIEIIPTKLLESGQDGIPPGINTLAFITGREIDPNTINAEHLLQQNIGSQYSY